MYSVLIVDDYEIFRQEIRSMDVWDNASGFSIVAEASDGREALAKLRQKPVDLLLTDIRMPFINGLELLKKVMEEKLSACVVLMSQFGDFEYARQGLANGAFEYLLKPLDPKELLACLKRAAALIEQRKSEIAKISYLDKILSQNSEEYFPDGALETLINLLIEGSIRATKAVAAVVDEIYSSVDLDAFKTAHILNRVTNKLISEIQNEYKWLDKFINLRSLRANDIQADAGISAVKQAFVQKIGTLLAVIRKFELGIENSSMVRMVCRSILENIDSEISVNELSNTFFITRTYLSQIFKEKTGIKLVDYLTMVRVERAKVLLAGGFGIDDILDKLGYQNAEYFKQVFKKVSGMTIAEFRNVNMD